MAADDDQDVILIRTSTSPDDVAGMLAVHGIVTEIGGTTSHAAVISREIGKPAVVGCGVGVATRLAGKVITIDGSLGEVREGAVELVAVSERDKPDLSDLADIARRVSPLRAHFTGTHPALSAASESAVRDALTAGHTDVICDNPLITMLTAIRLEHVPHDRLPPTAEHRLDQLTLLRGRRAQGPCASHRTCCHGGGHRNRGRGGGRGARRFRPARGGQICPVDSGWSGAPVRTARRRTTDCRRGRIHAAL